MATRQTIVKRADLAANFQSWATKPNQDIDFFEAFGIPAGEDMITIPAAADESAVVTMHRIERTGAEVVVLLTDTHISGRHRAIPFRLGGVDSQPAGASRVPQVVVEPGMTVLQWLDRVGEFGGAVLTVSDDSGLFAYLSDQMDYDISA